MNLEDFLHLDEKKEVEAQLVHWEDIDAQSPQYAPLLYFQVISNPSIKLSLIAAFVM